MHGKKLYFDILLGSFLSVSIIMIYSVPLDLSLHSYDKQVNSWLVHLCNFYYSIAVKIGKTHSLTALTCSFNDPSQLINKNPMHSPTVK